MQESDYQAQVPVIYSNSVNFNWNLYDFALLFGTKVPDLPQEPNVENTERPTVIQAQAQVILSPTHFKKFVEVANRVLNEYEAKYGRIAVEQKSE